MCSGLLKSFSPFLCSMLRSVLPTSAFHDGEGDSENYINIRMTMFATFFALLYLDKDL